MAGLRVGINGFGRIGRTFVRAVLARGAPVEVVAVNDPGAPLDHLAALLELDSVAGPLGTSVRVDDGALVVGDMRLPVLTVRDPDVAPWGELGVDLVVECSRRFLSADKASRHLDAGARTVLVTAPCDGADATFVVGVNEGTFDPGRHRIISNASCTTNCLAPMAKVLDDAFGIEHALMTTVHAYTSEQSLVDGVSDDVRRARAAAVNIVPASSGAARAVHLVLDGMEGRLDGAALRVPVADGSITDLTALLTAPASVEDVNAAFRDASSVGPLARVLDWSDRPIVSSDIVGSPASCTFDAPLTKACGPMVKVFGWYDNEWGYTNRVLDLALHVGRATVAA